MEEIQKIPHIPKEILRIAAKSFGVAVKDITGRSRSTTIFRARKEAARRMREECRMSYPEIGDILNRDHSTIIHMLRPKKQFEQSGDNST